MHLGRFAVALQTKRSTAAFDLLQRQVVPIGMLTRNLYSRPVSEDLRRQSCAGACSRETPKLTQEEVSKNLPSVPDWKVSVDLTSLSKTFVAKNFREAISFFNQVTEVAEVEGHHPDLHLTNYRDVEVVISTHAIKGLSINDFFLAAKIDSVPVEFSPKWLAAQKHESRSPAEHSRPPLSNVPSVLE